MAVWEYKVISSGKGGFASPALLEKFLGDLGRDEWEIIHYQTAPDNPLAFSGLARRPTQRDWTLEDAAAAAAKAETEKLRAEFEAKFKGATFGAPTPEEPASSFLEEKVAPDDGFRKPIDTSHDADADDEEEKAADEWDRLTEEEDELPTFFEAIRPHMRRNQRGPGMSVGVDYLAKKWDQTEEDIRGALVECGFEIPEDEDAKPVYLEYDGDLYWLNLNRRGELWINTKEKPRPVFRPIKAERVAVEEPAKPEGGKKEEKSARRPDPAETPATTETADITPPEPLPAGPALLEKIQPLMRRNRRGPGVSGSASFLSRALKCTESELKAGFASLGLVIPIDASEKPVNVEIGDQIWWLNLDSRGGLWINGREKRASDAAPEAGAEPAPAAAPEPAATEADPSAELPPPAVVSAEPASASNEDILTVTRERLKPARGGTLAAKLEGLAEETGHALDELVKRLVDAGLKLPEKAREKPVQVEHAGAQFWLSRTAKGELWLNARPAGGEAPAGDSADADGEAERKRSRRGRSRKSEEAPEGTESAPAEPIDKL